jgi:hypothetical protein
MGAAEALGYELAQCRLRYLHAVISRERGDDEGAGDWAERCLALAERVGTLHDQVLALWELAAACRDAEALPRTSARLLACVQACRRRGEALLEAYLLLSLGGLRLRFGVPGARSAVEGGLATFVKHSVLFGQCVGLRLLGEIEHASGNVVEAVARLTAAVRVGRTVGSSLEQALSLTALGGAHRANGARDAARRALEEARGLFCRLGNEREAAAAARLLEQVPR